MGEIWFTSDTHFGHKNIMTYCPGRARFLGIPDDASVDEMSEALVNNWNNYIQPGDIVVFMGDLAMGKIDDSLGYVAQLNGDIKMYWGNHDRPHYCNFKRDELEEWTDEKYTKHLKWVHRYSDAGIHTQQLDGFYDFGDGLIVQLNHFPYTGDTAEEDRYNGFRPEDSGMVLVHGHVHDHWQVKGRQINVGWDAWGRPLHVSEVKALVVEASR